MLDLSIRNKEIVIKTEHFPRMAKERKHLFPSEYSMKEIFNECASAIKNPKIGVFLEDKRNEEKTQSNYICVFLGISGQIIALPCFINEEIVLFTIKDVKKEFGNPNWYIRGYNEIGSKRGIASLPLIVKTTSEEDKYFI